MKDSKPRGYYVYELVDPFDNEVFYVGKGKGRRMYAHELQARTGTSINKEKHDRITEIHRLGGKVTYRIVQDDLDEPAAFKLERQTIKRYGMHNLTNALPGSMPPGWRDRMRAQRLYNRVRDPGPWLWGSDRFRQEIYFDMTRYLYELATTGAAVQGDGARAAKTFRLRGGRYVTAHPETSSICPGVLNRPQRLSRCNPSGVQP